MTDRAANWRDTDPRDPRNDRPRRLTPGASSNSTAELPAERCDCGVVSRGLVDGKCADCRAIPNSAAIGWNQPVPIEETDEFKKVQTALGEAAADATRNRVAELERENRWLRDIIYEYVGTDPENIDPDGPQ